MLCLALGQAQAVALEDMDVVLIKVGGSSITDKAIKETLNIDAIEWFARILSSELSTSFRSLSSLPLHTNESITSDNDNDKNKTCRSTKTAFIVIHGAGSFGHQSAKEYGLKGQMHAPQPVANRTGSGEKEELHRRRMMQGVAKTRLSVQTLNRHVVSTFVEHGMNAVSISPCFSVPSMQAHGGDETAINFLSTLVKSTLQAGLVPVLHGDACLYGESDAGILSGDTLMEMLGKADWVSRAVFLTDVDGVFTKDPRSDPTAQLLRTIEVDKHTAAVVSLNLEVSGSSHAHDVTGGLKVSKHGDTLLNHM
jgi:isopentenyl phosphate kinase